MAPTRIKQESTVQKAIVQEPIVQESIVQESIVEIDIAVLAAADSPRICGEDVEHIQTLAMAESQLPPIVVHRPTMRVIDGMHRVRAARLRGDEKIAVRFFDGTEDDAFVLAVRTNIAHGLPLSLADRKRAAERIVISHPHWSDRMIAAVAGIAAATVAEVRRRQPGISSAVVSRIGLDGRVRPIDGAMSRRLAGQLMTDNPGLSLRRVARAAGISPETARDVRNRLSRGLDPVPGTRAGQRTGPTAGSTAGSTAGAAGSTEDRRPASRSGERSVECPGERSVEPSVERSGEGLRERSGESCSGRSSAEERAAIVARLKADPAMRLNEAGRGLLRLLSAHALDAHDWTGVIANVPAHRVGVVAQVARELAGLWTDFAVGMERRAARIG